MSFFTPVKVTILTALFIVCFENSVFFEHVTKIYPFQEGNIGFVLSLGIVLYALIVILLTLLSSKYTLKPLLIFTLLFTATVGYFMQTYHIIVDKTMIENTLQTNLKESMDLLSFQLVLHLIFMGILPSFIIYKIQIKYGTFKLTVFNKIKTLLIHLGLIAILLFTFSKHYTSFFREHKTLRLYTNPLTPIYNFVAYSYTLFKDKNIPLKKIGLDAKQIKKESKRKIVIMVVGEAARSDHFSLNGYIKQTNPQLKNEDIINFPELYSCGTTTAVSVPCMFSVYKREAYDSTKGRNTYNVLDILSHAGVDVLWRDNNSDSKGVAVRLPYEDYKTAKKNTVCDSECRDEGMLVGLEKYIHKSNHDMIIVLHQMGNHGPAYYKRYPEKFNTFTPVCKTNQLEKCKKEEISNAYDNAVLYTDYFLVKVIDFLKTYEHNTSTAMIYMADHGESLGENGLYLHGLPYFIAPEHQKHVGALMWFGKDYPIDKEKIKQISKKTYSHDNLFSTLLGLFNVQTEVYEERMDMLRE